MALIRSGMVEHTSGTTALALKMEHGQSARVRRIEVVAAAAQADDYTIKIDRKSITQWKTPSAWYGMSDVLGRGYPTIVDALVAAGLWPVIPIASGEELTIDAPGANDYLEVEYDLYDEADVSADEPNGSKSATYRLPQVISNSAIVEAAGDAPLNQSDLDAQFPAFPGGEIVPSHMEMRLLAMFGTPAAISKATATHTQHTTYIKALADRADIFDKDLAGFPFVGNIDSATEAIDYAPDAGRLACGVAGVMPRLIVYKEPLIFPAGTELNVYATVVEDAAGGDFAAAAIKLGMLFDVVRV